MAFIKRNLKHFFVAFVLSVSVFLLFPFSVYAQNLSEMYVSFVDILPMLVLLTAAGFLLISFFTILVSKRLKYFPLLLTALLFCLWVQGNFIHYNLGQLDGHQINWRECMKSLWIEILVWAALLAMVVIFRKVLLKNNLLILVFLLLLFTLPNLFVYAKNRQGLPEFTYLDRSREFNFSENNVILIILDNYTSGAFDEILTKYPEYQETFKDFIYFEDAMGGFSSTKLAIPWILTGKYYQNLVPVKDYISSLEESTISYQLKEDGYIIESYPLVAFYNSIYDNHTDRLTAKEQLGVATRQVIVSGIRYSPLLLKAFFVARFYYGFNRVHNDMVAFNSGVKEVKVTTDQPLFKLIHLSGAHMPYELNSNLEWDYAGYFEQAAGSLVPVKSLLTELKQAGIYDDALILILGDHGCGKTLGFSTFQLSSYAQPLLLAKKAGQQFEELQISDAPVILGDVPKTITKETGIDADYPGYSIFDEIPFDRSRNFYFHTWYTEAWSMEYAPTFYEFEINGPASSAASYRYIGQYTDGLFIGADERDEKELIDSLFITQ